jgi:hypothetical protein
MRRKYAVAAIVCAIALIVGVLSMQRREPAELPESNPSPIATKEPPSNDVGQQFAMLVPPQQRATSKPDANGLVSIIRPLLTHVAAGDPIQIALHWAKTTGPVGQGEPIDERNQDAKFLRIATLNSMKFGVTSPDGTLTELQPNISLTEDERFSLGLYSRPTYILTLTTDGIADHVGHTFQDGQLRRHEGPWQKPPRTLFEQPGVYDIRVTGTIVRKDAKPIPFETPAIKIQVGQTGLATQAELKKVAFEAIRRKEPDCQLDESSPIVIDDGSGNRRVRAIGNPASRDPWAYPEYWVTLSQSGLTLSFERQRVDTCVARGTVISTLAGDRPIESLRIGELVWGYDTINRVKVRTTVRSIRYSVASKILAFRDTLFVTPTHPVFSAGTWKSASDVSANDQLLTDDLRHVPAGTFQSRSDVTEVYDITVDEPHNFFAGGFLVHNKSRPYSPRIDDIWYILWPDELHVTK